MEEATQETDSLKIQPVRTGHHSLLVGLGILLSKIAGFLRERALAHYLGNGNAADIFRAGLRIPNFLQNLFGEGVLSASFIPVYSGLLAKGEKELGRTVASTIFLLLSAVTALCVALGLTYTSVLTDLIAPWFQGEKRDALIAVVRILFPGVGLLVLSAWCLGVLNSHRRFFLSYSAPVVWNGAIIAVLVFYGRSVSGFELAQVAAWGVVIGSVLQLGVQLPKTIRLLGGLEFRPRPTLQPVRAVLKGFVPVVFGRGVVQVSAYIDSLLASLLTAGSVAALGYAQTVYLVPISLFGMSVSAAELPAMATEFANGNANQAKLRERIRTGLQRVLFFVIPSAFVFVALGDLLTGLLFESGRFQRQDTLHVWGVVVAATVGLIPAAQGRLYSSAFYARRDTATPLRFAIVRVVLAGMAGYLLSMYGPAFFQLDPKWGVAFIAFAGGLGAWVEFLLLRRKTGVVLGGETHVEQGFIRQVLISSFVAALAGTGVRALVGDFGIAVQAFVVLPVFGIVYLGMTSWFQIPEAQLVIRRLKR